MHDADDMTVLYQGLQWNYAPIDHANPGHGYAAVLNYIFSPTMVNQFTFGKGYTIWAYYEKEPSLVARSLAGNPPGLFSIPSTPKGYASPYQSAPEVDSFARLHSDCKFWKHSRQRGEFWRGSLLGLCQLERYLVH